MDQHGPTRADMVPVLGTPSRVSEVLRGKKELSMAMVQRLRARFQVSADLLLPPPKKARAARSAGRAAAWCEDRGTCLRRQTWKIITEVYPMTKKLPKRGLPPMHPGELLREEILPARSAQGKFIWQAINAKDGCVMPGMKGH
jgi:plasmid maintenance system antidote protein VapI